MVCGEISRDEGALLVLVYVPTAGSWPGFQKMPVQNSYSKINVGPDLATSNPYTKCI